jgi:hypothetical protein
MREIGRIIHIKQRIVREVGRIIRIKRRIIREIGRIICIKRRIICEIGCIIRIKTAYLFKCRYVFRNPIFQDQLWPYLWRDRQIHPGRQLG